MNHIGTLVHNSYFLMCPNVPIVVKKNLEKYLHLYNGN
jgi:hypothetical protein